jgi:hypothetical protein
MLRGDTPEQLVTGGTGDDVMAAVANTRDFNPEQTIQARNWLSELMGTMEKLVLRDVTPDELAARDGLNDLVKKYLNSRESDPDHLHDVSSDKLSARDIVDDFMAAVVNTRDFSPEQTPQARNWLTELVTAAEDFVLRDVTPDELAARDGQTFQARNWLTELATAAEDFVLRDVTPDELAARDGLSGFVKRFLNSRESGLNHLRDIDPEQTLQARNWLTELTTAVEDFVLRDVPSDDLAARDDLDDFMNTYFLNTRESVSQPDIQAPGTPDGSSKTVARDAVADGFIDALLKSRDSSDITPEDLLALASLASRTLDDLD